MTDLIDRMRRALDDLLVDAHGVPDEERDRWADRLARVAAPRAATEPPPPDMSNDIKLVANAILGSTSYLPHREAAERLLAAPRAATEPPLTRERLAAALHDGDLAPRAFGEGFTRPLMCKTMPPDRCVNRAQHEAAAESILAALATPPSAPLEETP